MPKFEGPGKCVYHKRELVWALKEWFCPDCETDPETTNPNIKPPIGIDGPDGFTMIDFDDFDKKGNTGI